MILRRLSQHVKDQNWFAVVLDFIIVVLGVFIGLQVNNWNAARADAEREMVYLAALDEDFEQVISTLERDVARYEAIADAMTLLIEQSRLETPEASLADLNAAAANLIVMVGTPIVSDTYSNLTGSGDLALIRNQDIRNTLTAFFGQTEVIALVSNTHEMQLVNIFQPYIIENLDYSLMFREDRGMPASKGTDTERILNVLASPELRNVAAVKWDISTDIHALMTDALADAKDMKALIASELERRQ